MSVIWKEDVAYWKRRAVQAEAECDELLAALKAMLHMHGKPQREEWLNEAGFGEAKAVDVQARAAIAKAEGGK